MDLEKSYGEGKAWKAVVVTTDMLGVLGLETGLMLLGEGIRKEARGSHLCGGPGFCGALVKPVQFCAWKVTKLRTIPAAQGGLGTCQAERKVLFA